MKKLLESFWDNKTVKRLRRQKNETKGIWILSFVFFCIMSIIILPEFNLIKIILLTFSASMMLVSGYEYFFKIVHYRIKDELSESEKNQLRLLFFILGIFVFYIFWVGILSNYYPFLEKLICCDLIKNVKIEI